MKIQSTLLILVALLAAGCSGETPLAPTPTPPAPAPVVTPPAPVFPSVTGMWTGTYVEIDSAVTPNYSLTVVCDAVWTVFSQSQDKFTGDLILSGTRNGIKCGGGLRITGTVTMAGGLQADQAWWPFDDVNCSLKSTENLKGAMTSRAVKLTQKDSWSCPPFLIAREITVDVSR